MDADRINEAVKKAIADSLGDIKRAIQGDLDEVVTKKVKQEETPTFKRKFNEDHFKHSKEIEKIMDRISSNLEDKDLKKAQENVEAGKKLLRKRQKLIKIADREDDGWEVIRCYQSDALASDSDDEKRLNKSRRQAKLNKKEARSRRISTSRRRFGTSHTSTSSNYKDFNKYYRSSKDTICYFCGREGHMQYSCPARRNDNSKGR